MRWLSFAVGCFMMLASGNLYMASLYVEDLKRILELSQTSINFALCSGIMGIAFFSVFYGMALDRFGPRALSILCGLLMLFSYLSLFEIFMLRWKAGPFALAFIMLLLGNGNGGCYMTSLGVSVRNFPEPDRTGMIIGCLVAFFGLSSFFSTNVYKLFFKPNLSSFMVFMSVFVSVIPATGAILMKIEPMGLSTKRQNSLDVDDKVPLVPEEEEEPSRLQSRSDMSPQVKLSELFRQPSTYVLYMLVFVGSGTGIMFFNNVGSILVSLGGRRGGQDVLVVLLSLCSFLGRLSFGFASDHLLARVTRSTLLVVALCMMGFAHLVTAFVHVSFIYVSAILVGLSHGALFTMAPSACRELFGTLHFGANWGFFNSAIGLGSLFFSTFVAGQLYDLHTRRNDGGSVCFGTDCFRDALLINAFSNFVVAAVALTFNHHRTIRSWYKPLDL